MNSVFRRLVAPLRAAPLLRAAILRSQATAARAFHVSALSLSHATTDRDLADKLENEFKFERESSEDSVPAFVRDFNSRGLFKIEDKPGDKEVSLVRSFGNEKISVIFSTDAVADKAEFDESESETDDEFSVNATIIIEKRSPTTDAGALELSTTIQGDSFFIDSVRFNPSSTIMIEQSAEADWQRSGRYGGPVFQDLDEGLQDEFHAFLQARGFDAALAEFIPQYIDFKEQNEYMNWLKNVSDWVSK